MDYAEVIDRLQDLAGRLEERSSRSLGFPLHAAPRLSYLQEFLRYNLNNLGDPFEEGYYAVNSFGLEREVVRWYAGLTHLPEAWGYVTSGGTEGNIRGLSFGKFLHPEALFYASETSHYSVEKAVRLMGAEMVKVRATRGGRLDLDDFRRTLNPDRAAVVNLNVGTTMSGAVDDVQGAVGVLKESGAPFYVHVDAALSGLLLPFTDCPAWDFRAGVHSIAVSGHKMLGTPVPSGIFVCRPEVVDRQGAEYLGSQDTTLLGSRSGLASVALWYAVQLLGEDGLRNQAIRCLETAAFAEGELRRAGWPCSRNELSNIVVLRRPSEAVVRRWQLCSRGQESHIVCMPHVSPKLVSEFVTDLVQSSRTAA